LAEYCENIIAKSFIILHNKGMVRGYLTTAFTKKETITAVKVKRKITHYG